MVCAEALKSKLRGANKAEAQVVVPVRRGVVVPVADRRVVGVVVPRTATFDAVRPNIINLSKKRKIVYNTNMGGKQIIRLRECKKYQ